MAPKKRDDLELDAGAYDDPDRDKDEVSEVKGEYPDSKQDEVE